MLSWSSMHKTLVARQLETNVLSSHCHSNRFDLWGHYRITGWRVREITGDYRNGIHMYYS